MPHTVKLSDTDIVEQARAESARQSRSLAAQITHWARIGRALERSPRFSLTRVHAVLEGRASPDALSAEEQAVWFDRFHEDIADPAALPGVADAFAALAQEPGTP